MKSSTLQIITWSVCACVLITVPLSYYLYFNQYGASDDPERWGQFGDFFGGVLNPIISLINLIILMYLSIRLVKDEDERNKWTLQELARPFGAIHLENTFQTIEISLKNVGLGPMILKKMLIKKEFGKEYINFYDLVNDILDQKYLNVELNSKMDSFHLDRDSGGAVGKDEILCLFKLRFTTPDPKNVQVLEFVCKQLKDYKLYIDYSDMYERKFDTMKDNLQFSGWN